MSTIATLGTDDAATHAVMLLDRVRLTAYAEAIRRVVRPGDVVVDVGTGSGVLAALAARAGARRVFALERGPVAQLARRVIADNGLAAVVEVVRVDARQATLPEPPTVLLGETLGSLGIDEGILALYALLGRQGAPGFRTIPSRVEPLVALVEDPALAAELSAVGEVAGVDLRALRAPLVQRVFSCRLRAADLASEPRPVGAFHPGVDALPRTLTARVQASRRCAVNAIGGWFQAELTPGVTLDSGPLAPPTHWTHLMFPVDPPLACEAGDEVVVAISPRVLADRSLWSWRVQRGTEVRSGDALAALLGDARDVAAQLGTPGAPESPQVRSKLDAFRAALAGDGPLEPGAMAGRLLAAFPERYASLDDASHEIWSLLTAARLSAV